MSVNRTVEQRDAGMNKASSIFGALQGLDRWPCKQPRSGAQGPYSKHPGCYRDEGTGDLGPYIRWLVALRLLLRLLHPNQQSLPWHQFQAKQEQTASKDLQARLRKQKQVRSEAEASATAALTGKELVDSFNGAFRCDGNGWKPRGRYVTDGFFQLLLDCLTEELGRPTRLTCNRVLEVRNIEPGARVTDHTLHRFEQWLRHDVHSPMDDVSDLECERLLVGIRRPDRNAAGPVRRELLGTVHRLLDTTSTDSPIVNVHSHSNRTELRALATQVLVSQYRARRRHGVQAPGPGIIYVSLCSTAGDSTRATRASVISQLRRCFGLPVSTNDPVHALRNLAGEMAELRRALTIHPTLIVFDSVEVNHGPCGAVLDYVKDAHWEDFIRALVQPDYTQLRRGKSQYPARFLVLSNSPLPGIVAWTSLQAALPPPPLSQVTMQSTGRLLLDCPERMRRPLRARAALLNAKVPCIAQHPTYRGEILDILYGLPALGGAPTEGDLALAGALPTTAVKYVLLKSHEEGVDRSRTRLRLAWRLLEGCAGDGEAALDLVVMLMVSASIDGLRLTTLARTSRRWLESIGLQRDHAVQLLSLVETCMNGTNEAPPSPFRRFPALMIYRLDDATAGVGLDQRRFELQHAHADSRIDGIDPSDPRLLDLRLNDIRQLLHEAMVAPIALMRDAAAAPTSSLEPTWMGLNRHQLWTSIHTALSEEALRQATTQVRNLDSRDLTSPYAHRRIVQAIYHGLIGRTHVASESCSATPPQAQPLSRQLPADPDKRYRYLYTFLFRDCLEGAPTWTLGRAFALSELKFQLLRLFLAPLFAGSSCSTKMESDDFDDFQREIAMRRDRHELDLALYQDLLEALGRAAYDTARYNVVDLIVKEARRSADGRYPQVETSRRRAIAPPKIQMLQLRQILVELNDMEVALNRVRTISHEALSNHVIRMQLDLKHLPFLKLEIDSLLSQLRVDNARDRCLEWLRPALSGVDVFAWGSLFSLPEEGQSMTGREKLEFEEVLGNHVLAIQEHCPNRRTTEAAADILSRLAEIVATEADSQRDWKKNGGGFLSSYAIYWVADRVRSGAGVLGGTTSWPRVSARSMRYYIRVSLKMSRILALGATEGSGAWKCAAQFYDHAWNRLDVYSRHLFRLPRERLAMLLLLAASARVGEELQLSVKGGQGLVESYGLQASFDYIARAEDLAIELGLPKILTYRIFFERIKTARRLVERGSSDHEFLRGSIQRDLEVLRRVADGNPFWLELVTRQDAAIKNWNDTRDGATCAGRVEENPMQGYSVFTTEQNSLFRPNPSNQST